MSNITPFDYYIGKHIHQRLKHYYNNRTADTQLANSNTYKFYKVIYDFLTQNGKVLEESNFNTINASGFFLDLFATNYNVQRNGLNDDDFREAIELRIFEIESTCTLEYVLQYINLRYTPNSCFIIQSNAKMICIANLIDDKMVQDINNFKYIIAAGVGFELVYSINIPMFVENDELFVRIIDNNNNLIIDNNSNPIIAKVGAFDNNNQFQVYSSVIGKVICENFN